MSSEYGVSVILPAWKTQNFIVECLRTLHDQRYFQNRSNWEILVGIDACKETRKVVESLPVLRNTYYHWFPKHSGPYPIRNTLAYKARFTRLLFLDSDDTFHPDLVSDLIKNKKHPVIAFIQQKKNRKIYGVGQFFITKELFQEFGGFLPWPCEADAEFHKRLKTHGIPKYKMNGGIQQKVYLVRGQHSNQLTKKPETAFRSTLRNDLRILVKENQKNRLKRVEPVFSEYELF